MINRPLPKEPMFTAVEAAAKLGISVKTLMRHVRDSRIRYINVGTQKRKSYRFTDYIMEQFINKNKHRETPAWQSSNTPKAPIGKSSSVSTVIPFEALQKPKAKRKQRQ
ncbi:helix-turn-helix domain-containing protein [Neorhizobium galegae]|uniref:helix-turn-helix domain-containing protein n=1 Tax=Neorhizobium galegae TaxID=399 RepID=UPI002105B4C9|nr:helix-turn-helix domain-containing protein [Neorhizobium galegae]MCQ1806167.1 helix-turn-helix domain-containing protein [Neorhizobium galegae]